MSDISVMKLFRRQVKGTLDVAKRAEVDMPMHGISGKFIKLVEPPGD